MCQNVADINLASVIVYRRDKSVFVASNVEHCQAFDVISICKSLFEFSETDKISTLDNTIPSGQRRS